MEQVILRWDNALIPAIFVLLIVLAAYVGHALGYHWLVTGKEKYLRPTYIVLLAAVAVLVLFNYPSFTLMGTYQQYHYDRAAMTPVWQNAYDFGIAWICIMLYFAATLLCLLWITWRETRTLCTTPGGPKPPGP